jgi:hypothetical protein
MDCGEGQRKVEDEFELATARYNTAGVQLMKKVQHGSVCNLGVPMASHITLLQFPKKSARDFKSS